MYNFRSPHIIKYTKWNACETKSCRTEIRFAAASNWFAQGCRCCRCILATHSWEKRARTHTSNNFSFSRKMENGEYAYLLCNGTVEQKERQPENIYIYIRKKTKWEFIFTAPSFAFILTILYTRSMCDVRSWMRAFYVRKRIFCLTCER